MRVDRLLADLSGDEGDPLLPPLSRSHIARLIGAGHLTVDGQVTKPSARLRGGERLVLHLPPPRPLVLVPEPMALEVLFEDEHLIAINKAAGMVVHPGAGRDTGTLVHGLLAHCGDLSGIGGVERPGIVHRLDRDTSGVLVVAKSDAAHRGLAAQFAERQVEKRYLAWVRGVPKPPRGHLDTPFGRHPKDRKRFSGRVTSGRRAVTDYKVRAEGGGAARVHVQIHTGRTHQIRVHLTELGHPVLGDALYGGRGSLPPGPLRDWVAALRRHALHAHRLKLLHPVSGDELELVAPVPPELARIDELMGVS